MPTIPAIYGKSPPFTGVYGATVFGRTIILQVITVPFEIAGIVQQAGADSMSYVVINRGQTVSVVSGV